MPIPEFEGDDVMWDAGGLECGALDRSFGELERARPDRSRDAERDQAREQRPQHPAVELAGAREQARQAGRLIGPRGRHHGAGGERRDEDERQHAAGEAEADRGRGAVLAELADELHQRRSVERAGRVVEVPLEKAQDRQRRDRAGQEQRGPPEQEQPPLERAGQRSAKEARRDHSDSSIA